jgi:transcriptional regulator with XRE-family HTH domain
MRTREDLLLVGNDSLGLKEFIRSEMSRRDMSGRAFAEFVGVTNKTITRYLNDPDATPSLDFLVKLSRTTKTDLISIISLAFPDVAAETRPSPEAIILAQRFQQLPEDVQNFLRSVILK